MAHKHSVYDTDTNFSINPVTRALKNEASTKTALIQHDHNSERFTFEIPRFVEGHDMSLCNVIQVHYNNINAQTKEQNSDVYEVDDMQISPEDENVVICSWLISQNATKHVGSLNFLLRFSCVEDDGSISYAWNTAIYSNISVSTGIYNTDMVYEEYSDLLEAWKNEVLGLEAAIRAENAAIASEQSAVRSEEAKNAASKSAEETKAIAAGFIPIANEAVKSALEKTNAIVKGVPSSNLFDKDNVTRGYVVNVSNGQLVPQASYVTSDHILVEEGETYTATKILASSSAYYDENKTFVSAIGAGSTIVIPTGVRYVRLGVLVSSVETYQFSKGDTLPAYEPYGAKINDIDDSFTDEAKEQIKNLVEGDNEDTQNHDVFGKLRNHLLNPFIKTQIKLLGDSITHGMGGTGFSATGEQIPGSAGKQNVLTATCWNNMLYHYINDYFNKDVEVSMLDERIKYNAPANNKFVFSDNLVRLDGVSAYVLYYKYARHVGNVAISNAIEFTFYGDHFSTLCDMDKYQGIHEIYVDDVKVKEVDAYSATTQRRQKVDITGLTLGEHTVRIATTGRRNSSSVATQLNISGLIIPKTAIVKPWGVSGSCSKYPLDLPSIWDETDDFVIMQFGTNDRHMFYTPDFTCENLIDATNTIKSATQAEVILMASCPASYSFEYGDDAVRYYHMWDVRNAVAKAAEHFGMPYVDNYGAFMRYASDHDVPVDNLLADGLHPNDLGYKVMFENIMQTIGLPIVPDYPQE